MLDFGGRVSSYRVGVALFLSIFHGLVFCLRQIVSTIIELIVCLVALVLTIPGYGMVFYNMISFQTIYIVSLILWIVLCLLTFLGHFPIN